MKNNKKKYILVINAGSATLKFKIFEAVSLKLEVEGIIERIGLLKSFIKINGKKEIYEVENHAEAFQLLTRNIKEYKNDIVMVGHRIVHGGEDFVEPTLLNKKVLKKLKKYSKLAPLHNPVNITCIRESMKFLPQAKDAGVFDTAFYRTLPDYAYVYAIPYKFYKKHKIRRYGFHGTSHQYVSEEGARQLKKPFKNLNLITCHLGSGCSITAVKKGEAIDTSMGFTPLEGLVMSTRSGTIDPSIPLFLMQELKIKDDKVYKILNNHSGLMGLLGTKDMREVLCKAGYKVPGFEMKKCSKKEQQLAQLTLNIFIYNIKKYIGAYKAVLGKVDAIIFTGGIGERSEIIRKLVLKDLLKIKHIVVPTNEELQIAKLIKKFI